MTVKALDWKKSCKLHFGAYTQVHEDRNVTNTIEEITQGKMVLGRTCNIQGAYNFFLIRYGKKITSRKFIEMPTPKIVMKRVVEMALTKKQKEGMIF